MADQNRSWVQVREFKGLVLSTDAHDRDPSQAADQVNLACLQDGQLQTRGGFRFVTFEDD